MPILYAVVSNRVGHLRSFAAAHDVILFVSGAKSSNGKVLFDECCSVNPHTYAVLDPADVAALPITSAGSVGVWSHVNTSLAYGAGEGCG